MPVAKDQMNMVLGKVDFDLLLVMVVQETMRY